MAGGEPFHQEFAGGDAGAIGQPHPPPLVDHLVEHLQGRLGVGHGPHRAKGRLGGIAGEHGHDGIADDLLDDPTVGGEHRPHLVEVAAEHHPQGLGVETLPELGRPGEVGEHHRDRRPDRRRVHRWTGVVSLTDRTLPGPISRS